MCEVLAVSCSGYYESLKRSSQQTRDNQVVDNRIVKIYTQHRGRYGAPRIHKELESMGKQAGKNRVARRMKRLGLKALAKRKWKATTDSKHALPVADNLLNRDFSANEPTLLQEKDLICSMNRAGECWGNAAMESFYHSLKIALIQFF